MIYLKTKKIYYYTGTSIEMAFQWMEINKGDIRFFDFFGICPKNKDEKDYVYDEPEYKYNKTYRRLKLVK